MSTKNPQTVSKPKAKAPAPKRAPQPSQARDVPRSLAGVVGKSGEIVDQDGRVIGKIPDRTKLSEIAGHDVTATGDILDDSGEEVLGKASLNKGEYTTQPAKDVKQKAGAAKPKEAPKPPAKPSAAKPTAQKPSAPKAPSAAKPSAAQPSAAKPSAAKPSAPKPGAAKPSAAKPSAPPRPSAPKPSADTAKPAAGAAKKAQQPAAKGAGAAVGQAAKAKAKAPQQQPEEETQPPDVAEPSAEEHAEALEGEEEPPEAAGGVGEEELEEGEEEAEEGGEEEEAEAEEEEEEGEEGEEEEEEPAEELEGEEAEEFAGAEEELPEGEELDFSVLQDATINKAGNLVNEQGDVVGHLVEGEPKKLAGKKSDEMGQIWDDSGNVIGMAEPLPLSELEAFKDFAPFENFPDAKVEGDGRVTSEGLQVGVVVEGDPRRLKGSKVDEDGDILDRRGNVVGRAEPYDEPEPEPEEEIDVSILAGKKVNKSGNVVDEVGSVFGRVVEGNVSAMVGRTCDKNGNVLSETGEVMGRAEMIPEEEREKLKVGAFEDLTDSTVTKDGKVVTPAGDVVGRLVEGDPKQLFGRPVDADGEIVDKSGNVLGRAERYEEPEEEPSILAGRKVNQEGNITDEDGNIIAKLTSGDALVCSGKEVDSDGDVINSKGDVVGHVTLMEELPQDTEEEKAAREKAEQDRELAGKLAGCIEDGMERVRPICSMIIGKLQAADAQPPDELDEEQVVREVKPLIEEGGKILTELNGSIRGMDPDGRIQKQAKAKAGTQEASPEEHHLAEVVKELHTTVEGTIEEAKAKLESMPHAKEELDPLFGLMSDPLAQIIAAVGLLLSGVLGLVGKLTGGLGLDKLLGGVVGGVGGSVGKTGKKAVGGVGGIVGGLGGIGGIAGGGKK